MTCTGQLLEMEKARYGHTATLLVSGNVLVAGGAELAPQQVLSDRPTPQSLVMDQIHADADLYLFSDTTPSFSGNAVAMNEPRVFHVSDRGSGNLVLVAGGQNSTEVHQSTELYNPDIGALGDFNAGDDLMVPRTHASLTRLGNGKLLIAGGLQTMGSPSSATNSVEFFDPEDGSGGSTVEAPVDGRLGVARWGHRAVLMSDNQRVLVVGGLNDAGFTLTTATLLGDGETTETINDAGGRVFHSLARLLSGDVLVVGGAAMPASGGVQLQLSGMIYTPSLVGQ